MVYLAIKELSVLAEDVFVVTSSLTKDMNARADLIYRPNAIRALCKITDASMMQGIERFIKQAIVDKNTAVASAALVSAVHLFPLNRDVVRRWSNEAQEAITSKSAMAQYHALGLIYLMRQHDRMAIIKLVQGFARGSMRSPHAVVMLIRYASKIMDEEDGNRMFFDQLESWLRHKSDMVVYEAARAICSIKNVTQKELFPAISSLQLMLVNHKPTLRFAALRTLNKLAMLHPQAVFPCNLDMENLITDTNRSIATFAITTLLKTGNEGSVDRLMKQISGFMTEISDDFKIIVVDAVRSLCLKFPSKHLLMLGFLASGLRDEGGYAFKKAIIEAIFDIVDHIPESKVFALSQLCEFIEDCEFTKLAVRILHLISTEGPKVENPARYIRYIYNRVILENSVVRAAAVSALAQFGVHLPESRSRIRVLLTRCLEDLDDEVRDRAAVNIRIFDELDLTTKYIANDSVYAVASLETKLDQYLRNEAGFSVPFDVTSVPLVSKAQLESEKRRAQIAARDRLQAGGVPAAVASAKPGASSSTATAAAASSSFDAQSVYSKQMERVPQLASLGPLFKSSSPVELTEAETEYYVTCIKHVFPQHIVFQYECKNTLNDSILENVSVVMAIQPGEDEEIGHLKPEFCIPAERLIYDTPSSVYIVYSRIGGVTPSGTFSNILKFVVKDCDPNTGEPDEQGFDDEYQVEDVDVVVGDYIIPAYITDFEKAWQDLGETHQVVETYALTAVASIKTATESVINILGMHACQQSGDVKDRATTHQLLLTGTFVGGISAACRCRMAFSPNTGVALEISVRSGNAVVSNKIANAIG